MELFVHAGPDDVARAVAARLAGAIDSPSKKRTLGLSGGTTPIATYEFLRNAKVNWPVVDAWVSDERWVHPDHERSNGRMAVETLIRHVGVRFSRPGWSELIGPEESSEHYESLIRDIHRSHRPDVIHLGMGEDGHTASLFPGSPALEERVRWIVVNHIPGETRITATYPLLWSARLLIVQVTGASKAEAVRQSLEGLTPAGLLGDGDATVEWHIDQEAAGSLD